MKILLLGANGQIGWELQRSLLPLGQVKACDRNELDLEDTGSLRSMVREFNPDVIVNAAAYTAVDKAESEPEVAYKVNAEAVEVIAQEAKALKAWLVHYSTDYVFDGTGTAAYSETDSPNPQSVYGQTKLEGEEAIRESGCKHLIFRTSWVYAARGSNFAKIMLRLAAEKNALNVVSDQFGVPTAAELIADVTALATQHVIRSDDSMQDFSGTYHLAPSGETNWYEYAKYVIGKAKSMSDKLPISLNNIMPVTTSDYPTPARRPANSRLNTQKLSDTFGLDLPPWQAGVDRLVTELVDQEFL